MAQENSRYTKVSMPFSTPATITAMVYAKAKIREKKRLGLHIPQKNILQNSLFRSD
jgi:hypothetical protein